MPILRPLRSSPLDWLRQRAVLLDEDPQAADGFTALMERDGTPEPAQGRDWP